MSKQPQQMKPNNRTRAIRSELCVATVSTVAESSRDQMNLKLLESDNLLLIGEELHQAWRFFGSVMRM